MRSRVTEWQAHNCFQSNCRHIAEHDCPAVRLNDRAGDCQPEANAAASNHVSALRESHTQGKCHLEPAYLKQPK